MRPKIDEIEIDDIVCSTCKKVIGEDTEILKWHVQGACVPRKATMNYWKTFLLCGDCAAPVFVLICRHRDALRAAYWGYKPRPAALLLSDEVGTRDVYCPACRHRREEEERAFINSQYRDLTADAVNG